MRNRAFLVASAVGMFGVASPVMADPPLGSRLGERTSKKKVEQEGRAARGAHELARCMADKRKQSVSAYLASIDEKESERLSSKLAGEHQCFNIAEENAFSEGRMVTFPQDIYRGMLAEWMIKGERQAFAMLPVLPRQLIYQPRDWFAVSGRDVTIDEMATCVSDIAPAEILSLLDTTPYTKEEIAVFGSLSPRLGECLRAGVRMMGNRQSVRAALADALYQRVANPGPPPSPAPKPAG